MAPLHRDTVVSACSFPCSCAATSRVANPMDVKTASNRTAWMLFILSSVRFAWWREIRSVKTLARCVLSTQIIESELSEVKVADLDPIEVSLLPRYFYGRMEAPAVGNTWCGADDNQRAAENNL